MATKGALMPGLSRDALLDCIKSRHHYATTGGPSGRMLMDLSVTFDQPATLYHDDPALYKNSNGTAGTKAMMGDIVHLPSGDAQLSMSVTAASPIRRIDLYNGLDHMECHRPYTEEELGNRIGVIWGGAEYRGRFRSVPWDGTAHFDNAKITSTQAVNFFNRDKSLDLRDHSTLTWKSVTTGNFAGFIATLEDSEAGSIQINTPLITETLSLMDIGFEDSVLDASATLPRGVSVFRLPNQNTHTTVNFERTLSPLDGRDNPYFVRVTLEDGTQGWSSPVYVIRSMD
jgi:hypothetical protein